MAFKKFVKQAVKGAKRFVKKRYNLGKKKKGSINVGALAQDVAKMAMMINAEKKVYAITANNTLGQNVGVGQVSANVSGTRVFDITPLISQGATAETRNGDSIKLHSAYFQFMVSQQTNGAVANRCSIEIWHNNGGALLSETDFLNALYQPTVFSSVIDYQSTRNIDRMGDFRLARKMIVSLPSEEISGQKTVRYVKMPLKFNRGKGHHIRYSGSTIVNNPLTDLINGRSQLFLVYRAEHGNRSGTVSTLNVPITDQSTGLVVQSSFTMYYYDN